METTYKHLRAVMMARKEEEERPAALGKEGDVLCVSYRAAEARSGSVVEPIISGTEHR